MAKEKKLKNPKGQSVTKEVEFDLTVVQFADKGKEAAAFTAEIATAKTEFHAIKKSWIAKIGALGAKRDDIDAEINAKKFKRTVETVMVKDFYKKTVEFWFEGEIVEQRGMTEQEVQMEIDFDKQKNKKDRAKKQKLETAPTSDGDVGDVIKEETNKRTKLSSVDGGIRA